MVQSGCGVSKHLLVWWATKATTTQCGTPSFPPMGTILSPGDMTELPGKTLKDSSGYSFRILLQHKHTVDTQQLCLQMSVIVLCCAFSQQSMGNRPLPAAADVFWSPSGYHLHPLPPQLQLCRHGVVWSHHPALGCPKRKLRPHLHRSQGQTSYQSRSWSVVFYSAECYTAVHQLSHSVSGVILS